MLMRSRLSVHNLNIRHPKMWLGVCIALGVVTLLIWGNSMRTSTQSAQQSGSLLAFLTPWLTALGIQPEGFHSILRKLAHFSEYGLLGVLWTMELWLGPHREKRRGAMELWRGPHRGKRRGAMERLSFCMLTAFLDETIQLFVPGRSGEIRDVWIDTAGAWTGIVITTCLVCIAMKFRNRNKNM